MKFHRAFLFVLSFYLITIFVSAQDKGDKKEVYTCFQEKAEKSAFIEKADSEHFIVRRVEFWGNPTTRDRETRKRMEFGEGDIFTKKMLEKSIRNLSKSKYFYPVSLENIRVRLTAKHRIIDMIFCMQEKRKNETSKEKIDHCSQDNVEKSSLIDKAESQPFRVRRIVFWGNVFIRDRELRKRLAFREGDVFRKKLLAESIKSLSRSTYIYPISLGNVKIKLSEKNRMIDMTFCIKERPEKVNMKGLFDLAFPVTDLDKKKHDRK